MNPTHETPSGPITVDPDAAFLGCLMRCDAPTARDLLAGMRPDDLADPISREVLALAIRLNLREHAPGPAALYAEARRTGRLDTEHKHTVLADWLIDTYRAAPDPVVGDYLKTAVLEGAYRRALREHATRMLARVDHADASELADLATLDDRTVDLEHRHRQATEDDTARPIAPAAPSAPATGELSAITERLNRTESPPAPSPGEPATDSPQRRSARSNGQRGEAA